MQWAFVLFFTICGGVYACEPHVSETQIGGFDPRTYAVFDVLSASHMRCSVDECLLKRRPEGTREPDLRQTQLLQKINHFVTRNAPLPFFLPAFPFKCPARGCVVADMPDMAERAGLESLNALTCKIKEFYPPGAKILIVMHGQLFADIFNVSDETVQRYGNAVKTLACDLEGLAVLHLNEYLEVETAAEARILVQQLAPVPIDQAKKSAYEDFKSFRTLRQQVAPCMPGAPHLQKTRTALDLMARRMQMRTIVQDRSAHMISLFSQTDNGTSDKLALMLCDGSMAISWYSVMVVDPDGTRRITPAQEVDRSQYTPAIETINGVPCSLFRHKDAQSLPAPAVPLVEETPPITVSDCTPFFIREHF